MNSIPLTSYKDILHYEPECNLARLKWDMQRRERRTPTSFAEQKKFQVIDQSLFARPEPIWLEIGAGTGAFFAGLAERNPDRLFIALERCKLRGQRLARKAEKTENFFGYRGNAVPALVHGVPAGRLERIYILYPCPWPKNSQRRNRWHMHPVMPYLVRALAPGGFLVLASDQKFYVDEARWVCENEYGMKIPIHGRLEPNEWNGLEEAPQGRSKFERDFLLRGQPCYELVAQV